MADTEKIDQLYDTLYDAWYDIDFPESVQYTVTGIDTLLTTNPELTIGDIEFHLNNRISRSEYVKGISFGSLSLNKCNNLYIAEIVCGLADEDPPIESEADESGYDKLLQFEKLLHALKENPYIMFTPFEMDFRYERYPMQSLYFSLHSTG